MRSTLIQHKQGEEATARLIRSRKSSCVQDAPFDLILLTRGGGSPKTAGQVHWRSRRGLSYPCLQCHRSDRCHDRGLRSHPGTNPLPRPTHCSRQWMQSLDNISNRLAQCHGRIQQGERILSATAKRLETLRSRSPNIRTDYRASAGHFNRSLIGPSKILILAESRPHWSLPLKDVSRTNKHGSIARVSDSRHLFTI